LTDNTFPRSCRLLTAADYKAVFDGAELKVSSKYFLILARVTTPHSARVGLIIAKKNVKKAVQRNRLKRQIRQAFRVNKDLLEHLDLVVLAKKDADKLSNPAVASQLTHLWNDMSAKLARKLKTTDK
jgi:ribonuclease P protein component